MLNRTQILDTITRLSVEANIAGLHDLEKILFCVADASQNNQEHALAEICTLYNEDCLMPERAKTQGWSVAA